jgi:phenylalanyl-tRNA synthetase beta chain
MNNGYKPLNNILDLLNIITILTNTPTSAYDADKCKDFEAGFAKNGEKFLGFDGKEYKLTNKDAVVRSNGEIICLGGILGDAKYGINNETKNIYVEFAN